MATTVEYAMLSSRVYDADPSRNRTFVPPGWTELTWQADLAFSGFSAGAYRNNATGEIVVAYTGTNDKSVDWASNFLGGTGILTAPQIEQAMLFYQQIKAANPPGTLITFTGHSLGGGLASLMGVFVDRPAVTFAEAPFELSATSSTVLNSLSQLLQSFNITDSDFSNYLANPDGEFLRREQDNVIHYRLSGEAVGVLTAAFPEISSGGGPINIDLGTSSAGMVDRHSMLLHAAVIQSLRENGGKFLVAVRKMPNFVTILLDPALYAAADRRDTSKTDLLSMILRHQFGDGASISADGMLDGFGRDAYRLAQGGLIKDAVGLEDTLIKAMLQGYYRLEDNQFTQDLFTEADGGFYLDTNRIATNASLIVSYSDIAQALLTYYGPTIPMATYLAATDRWYFQSGPATLGAVAEDGHNNFMAGAAGSDQITGASGNDVVLGGAGADTLQGNQGNDTLLGGTGVDIYKYRPNDGADTIVDSDKKGIILYDPTGQPQALAVGLRKSTDPTGQYQSPDNTITYQVQGADLTITTPTGTITVKDFNQNNKDLSIRLIDLPPDPTTTLEWPALDPDATLPADQRTAPNWDGLRNGTTYSDYTGSPDNVDLNGDGSNDIGSILGTNDAEIIHGLAGNDFIDGHGGADRLYGDEGSDTIYFYSPDPVGDALADGGSGRDAIVGWSDGHNHFIGGGNDDPQDEADLLISQGGNDYLEGGQSRMRQPELLRLVRKTNAAYRHGAGHHENENQIKEAA